MLEIDRDVVLLDAYGQGGTIGFDGGTGTDPSGVAVNVDLSKRDRDVETQGIAGSTGALAKDNYKGVGVLMPMPEDEDAYTYYRYDFTTITTAGNVLAFEPWLGVVSTNGLRTSGAGRVTRITQRQMMPLPSKINQPDLSGVVGLRLDPTFDLGTGRVNRLVFALVVGNRFSTTSQTGYIRGHITVRRWNSNVIINRPDLT